MNDGNGLSVHRLQAGVWTLFLGAVFVWSVAKKPWSLVTSTFTFRRAASCSTENSAERRNH